MLGGVLSGVGMAASSFTRSITELYVTAGVITGQQTRGRFIIPGNVHWSGVRLSQLPGETSKQDSACYDANILLGEMHPDIHMVGFFSFGTRVLLCAAFL